MNGGVGFLMKKNKVDVIWGEAKLTKPGEIVVGKTTKKIVEPQAPLPKNTKGEGTYTAKHIIVATGARPRALPGIEPDGKLIWTYFEAMKPRRCRNRSWSWARAPSASSSPPSTAPWAST
jgi:dihydrolipoamide dehydrogenase